MRRLGGPLVQEKWPNTCVIRVQGVQKVGENNGQKPPTFGRTPMYEFKKLNGFQKG